MVTIFVYFVDIHRDVQICWFDEIICYGAPQIWCGDLVVLSSRLVTFPQWQAVPKTWLDFMNSNWSESWPGNDLHKGFPLVRFLSTVSPVCKALPTRSLAFKTFLLEPARVSRQNCQIISARHFSHPLYKDAWIKFEIFCPGRTAGSTGRLTSGSTCRGKPPAALSTRAG